MKLGTMGAIAGAFVLGGLGAYGLTQHPVFGVAPRAAAEATQPARDTTPTVAASPVQQQGGYARIAADYGVFYGCRIVVVTFPPYNQTGVILAVPDSGIGGEGRPAQSCSVSAIH